MVCPQFSLSHLYIWAKGNVLHLHIETSIILWSFQSTNNYFLITYLGFFGDGPIINNALRNAWNVLICYQYICPPNTKKDCPWFTRCLILKRFQTSVFFSFFFLFEMNLMAFLSFESNPFKVGIEFFLTEF